MVHTISTRTSVATLRENEINTTLHYTKTIHAEGQLLPPILRDIVSCRLDARSKYGGGR